VRSLLLVVLVAACGSDPLCGSGKVDSQYTLSNATLTVVITTAPYSLEIRDASGHPVLASAGAGSGDGYGSLGWTTGKASAEKYVDQGYFTFGANLDPWRDHGRVISATQTATELDLVVETGDGCVNVSHVIRDGALRVEAHREKPKGTPRAWEVAWTTPADEAFVGLGERYDRVDHRGMALYNWPEEGGLTEGEDVPGSPGNPFPNGPTMTYYPVPFFLSTQGYGFWLDTTWRNEFDFASDRSDAWRAWHVGPDLAFEVYVGTPLAILDTFTAATGRPMIPPAWSFGPRRRINRGAMIGNVSEIQAMRDNDLAITSADDTEHFSPNGNDIGHEAELRAWVQTAAALGYKMIGYYNPYYAADPASPLANLTAEGIANHYFLGDPDGTPGKVTLISGALLDVYTVDVTSDAAVAWFTAQFKRALDLGYSGWMYDFGEYVQPSWVASDGETGMELHDHFPVLYDKAAHDALEQLDPGDWYYFSRSGYTGSQQYAPMTWGGDPDASFGELEGLPAQVRATITLSMAGVAHVGSDIGGFKCIHNTPDTANGELLARWIEVGAMCSDMHDEDSCSGGGTKASIWTAPEAQTAWKTYARLHTRLAPYMVALAAHAHATGTPLVMSPWLVHPERPGLAPIGDMFYFGPGLLVAPVVERGATTKTVTLPPGNYIDWRDGTLYTGDAMVTLPAPLAELPLMLVDGQLVPMLDPTIDTLAPESDPNIVGPDDVAGVYDVVGALSAAAGHASFTLADGTTLDATYTGGLTSCTGCTVTRLGPRVQRVQVTGPVTGALTTATTSARQIRWDLYLID
jgi:alpha-glucosidase